MNDCDVSAAGMAVDDVASEGGNTTAINDVGENGDACVGDVSGERDGSREGETAKSER